MTITSHIIQWNCRGIKANFSELQQLAALFNPLAFCLQETHLLPSHTVTLKNYSMFNVYGPNVQRPSGGAAILVRNDLIHSHLVVTTHLQVVAVRLTLHKVITLCSVYIPPAVAVTLQDLDILLAQLPPPYIFLGDFNAHNPAWGGTYSNSKGKVMEDFIAATDICLWNDGSSTYLHPGHGTYSAIDLSMCDPDLFLDFSWRPLDDLCGSDHFPLIMSSIGTDTQLRPPRWQLQRADWSLFQYRCDIQLGRMPLDIDNPADHFTKTLISIAEEAVPKTSGKPHHRSNPWFNDDCKKAIHARKKAERVFNKHPTAANLTRLKISRAQARRTINAAKSQSWREYVSSLTGDVSSKKVWSFIRKMKSKGGTARVQHLQCHTGLLTSKEDIAEELAEAFEKNSSVENCNPDFQTVRRKEEARALNFSSDNAEPYNQPFCMDELLCAIRNCHDTAVGPDMIHYQFLKHLPSSVLPRLLAMFNVIWESGTIPESWKKAFIIPIPKPGKDHTDPTNYRPIALTSCLCKTLERMVNKRLVWMLESDRLLSDFQCGFRRGRSTMDHLVRLEAYIRDAFVRKEHAIAVFFDLEKAYDTTWKYGILRDLHYMGFRGRLPIFISNFLSNRFFQVQLGTTFSRPRLQEQGVPQGSILSVTLFSIKINSIAKEINPNLFCSLYVDDLCICYRGKYMGIIERQLQLCINKISTWSTDNGFKFSKSKTVCTHFCQLRALHHDPLLYLEGAAIPVAQEVKFLGLLLDNKLSFIPHMKTLKKRCIKTLDILKVLAKTKWGAEWTVLLRLYRALVRSRLDYGSIVYGSARASYIKMLDTVHHQGLRLALGAFRTSPVQSLYVEAREPSLQLRRLKLSFQYAIKVKGNRNNPAYPTIFQPQYLDFYEARPRSIRPFGLRIKPLLEDLSIDMDGVTSFPLCSIPPWDLRQPVIVHDLSHRKKSSTHPTEYSSCFLDVRQRFPLHTPIYTDGSKTDTCVSSAMVVASAQYGIRIPNLCSVFTAEARALLLSLEYIEEFKLQKSLICTDSRSCLQALEFVKTDHPLIVDILRKVAYLTKLNVDIIFCWVPGHVGLPGNEKADNAAREALNREIAECHIPVSDIAPVLCSYISDKWQADWTNCVGNKLRELCTTVKHGTIQSFSCRYDQVVYTRCRIGHSRYTHGFLLTGGEPPLCDLCGALLSIKHIFSCPALGIQRRKFFKESTMIDIFTKVPPLKVLNFLKCINVNKCI